MGVFVRSGTGLLVFRCGVFRRRFNLDQARKPNKKIRTNRPIINALYIDNNNGIIILDCVLEIHVVFYCVAPKHTFCPVRVCVCLSILFCDGGGLKAERRVWALVHRLFFVSLCSGIRIMMV